ncbi:MAG: glycosyltransferase, partial [Clostridia bacterium]|nr:glycosyltransferase [Clostridia bacterium]
NSGIERAGGEYLGFVAGDDRIEPDIYERMLKAIEEDGADIAVCGRFMEYPGKTEIISPPQGTFNREEAVKNLALLKIRNPAWDKLWRRECFEEIRFPDGRVYEDIATTYRVFLRTQKVVCIPDALYHYRIRESGISNSDSPDYLSDYFTSTVEEFEALTGTPPFCDDEEIGETLSRRCRYVYAKLRAKYNTCSKEERKLCRAQIRKADRFVRDNFRLLSSGGCSAKRKLTLFLSCRASSLMPLLTSVYMRLKSILKHR